MSIRLMSQIWADETIINQSELLVMLAIADFANDKGEAWPAIDTLALKARHSDRGIQKIITRLELSGHLQVERGGLGQKSTSTYRILSRVNGVHPNGGFRVNGEVIKGERGGSPGSPDPSGTFRSVTYKAYKNLGSAGLETASRFELALNSQWVNDAGKWINRIKKYGGKCRRVVAEVENAIKEDRITTTPAQYAEQTWKEFK